MPHNKAERGMDMGNGLEHELKTFEGQTQSMNNVTRGAVLVEYMTTGVDPLQGTGLSYGQDLKHDVSPDPSTNPEFGITSSAPGLMGSPEGPNSIPGGGSNPYVGMGKF